jgi:DNA-binding IclR family transcriptional regulator
LSAPAVERLHADTGLEASLGVPAYHGTLCVVRCCGDSAVQPPLGGTPPAHCTAPRTALLAHRESWCRAVLGAPLPRCTERSVTEPNALERELAQVRIHGYAVEEGEHVNGLRRLAAPVAGPGGEVLAAIAVAGYDACASVEPRDELPGRVRSTARTASEALAAGASEYPLHRGIVYRLLASYGLAPVDAYV